MSPISKIANELNKRAEGYEIGRLHEFRRNIKGFSRLPARTLFPTKQPTDGRDWTFHRGGLSELQFNVGFDRSNWRWLRYGVALSFLTNPSLHDISVIQAKVPLFNEYLVQFPGHFSRMKMWAWEGEVRQAEHMPRPISPDESRKGMFVFMGMFKPASEIDYDTILSTFDRLLPLYLFVESQGKHPLVEAVSSTAFAYRTGNLPRKMSTKAFSKGGVTDISLKHNLMMRALFAMLKKQYPKKALSVECDSGSGTKIDLVLSDHNEHWFYEIKPYALPRICIREALGQLLEYSHWAGGVGAKRLVVVGPSELDVDGQGYLELLRKQYSLPIEYLQVKV